MRKRAHQFLISAISLIFGLLSAQLYAATASVSANKVVKDEVFQLRIVADENLDSSEVDFSILNNDFYLGRPSFGSQTSYVNGVKSVRSEWTISLAPLKTGTIIIPAFTLGSETTAPIRLTVTADANAPKQDDLVEFQTKLSRQELYPGELAHLDTRLIIKTDLRRLKNAQIIQPNIEGADNQAIELKPIGKANQYQRLLNGVEVTIVDQSYELIARQAGKFVINGPALKGAIVGGQTVNGGTRLIPINTRPELIVIDILDKPEDYQGTWLPSPALTLTQRWLDENGQELASGSDTLSVHVGSPITREITLTAEGVEQEQLPNIQVQYPDTLRLYEEKPGFRQEENRVSMTLKQVLIPKQEGSLVLPDITIPWWNTKKKQQNTALAKGITLSVEKSDTPTLALTPTQPAQPVQGIVKTETITVKDPGFWPYLTAIFALLWLLFTILWILTLKKNRATPESEQEIPFSCLTRLLEAVEQQDGIQVQAIYKQWLSEHSTLDKSQKNEIDTEVSLLMASIYAPDEESSWNSTRLIRLLKKADKKSQKTQPKEEALASL